MITTERSTLLLEGSVGHELPYYTNCRLEITATCQLPLFYAVRLSPPTTSEQLDRQCQKKKLGRCSDDSREHASCNVRNESQDFPVSDDHDVVTARLCGAKIGRTCAGHHSSPVRCTGRRAVPSPCSPSGAGSCRFACSLVLCLASGRAHWGPRVHDNFLAHAHPRSRA